DDRRIVVIEIRLVREEAMPVVLLRDRIPRPVRRLGIRENDPRLGELLVRIAPDVEVPLRRARRRTSRGLEPRMLIRRVVHDELGDHLEPALVRLAYETLEVAQRAVDRIDIAVVRDVVAVVA